ncbi:hypothetical protein BN1221_04913c [Brenneria goodwinii]|uniref:Uncharacterized protein n=1 Tax=Brenneria goodwinii TaxID=1109412 RepID=A0A0G4K2H1_9GAMM|nr:hypothetical protein BN1221_04913c [Brenneria goodwinii]
MFGVIKNIIINWNLLLDGAGKPNHSDSGQARRNDSDTPYDPSLPK